MKITEGMFFGGILAFSVIAAFIFVMAIVVFTHIETMKDKEIRYLIVQDSIENLRGEE